MKNITEEVSEMATPTHLGIWICSVNIICEFKKSRIKSELYVWNAIMEVLIICFWHQAKFELSAEKKTSPGRNLYFLQSRIRFTNIKVDLLSLHCSIISCHHTMKGKLSLWSFLPLIFYEISQQLFNKLSLL